ncbi:uncharacterized protein [Diadema setosum]|uniref:uncharacterized protein n=1 Tax=Diadema setosum TaxID=31175 RepID=UPI003B3A9208
MSVSNCPLTCPEDNSCFTFSQICDGNYDCPLGLEEYNCPGCFSCSGSSECLFDQQVCDYNSDCPGGEDEAEALCGHANYSREYQIQYGVDLEINESVVFPERTSYASALFDYAQFIFIGPPGSYLFVKSFNASFTTLSYASTSNALVFGPGRQYNSEFLRAGYFPGFGEFYSISGSNSFSIGDSTGYALLVQEKNGAVNLSMTVSAVACNANEIPCNGSPHCYNPSTEYCDGNYQCVWSGEDESSCVAIDL